jgi:hypothetical protein
MKWQLKALVQKGIAYLPFGHRVNYLFQRWITVGPKLPRAFVLDRVNHALTHLLHLKENSSIAMQHVSVLEIGTGWYPIVPLVYMLSGLKQIYTCDIRVLFSSTSIDQSILAILELDREGDLKTHIPTLECDRIELLYLALKQKDAFSKLRTLQISFERTDYHLDTYVDGRFQLITSNNTLQLVQAEKLPLWYSNMHRIAAKDAILSLAIDYTDEFAHSDHSISQFNFLSFSSVAWSFWTNKLSAPNRLRHKDFKELLETKFKLLQEKLEHAPPSEVDNLKIHPVFKAYHMSEILIKHAYLVGKKIDLE